MIAAEREPSPMHASAAEARSPFVRLNELLAEVAPGKKPINLTVGEPQHPIPPFVGDVLARNLNGFGRYPMNNGTEGFRKAVSEWLSRRYVLPRPLDPQSEILVLNGTREGLFLAALAAKRHLGQGKADPLVLTPNPFYAVYSAGGVGAGAQTLFLPATRASGFLPDLEALDENSLTRCIAFYLATPSNPEGAVASPDYLKRLIGLARRYNFMLFADECYSEIYTREAPRGTLEYAGPDYANVAVFHSLSKRSNLPGLRVGFVAGDRAFLKGFLDLRSVAAPQVPVPAQEVAIAAYGDETHVEENRRLYGLKFDLADQIIGDRYGYKRPAGGFYLWLNVAPFGGSAKTVERLWREAGLRVLPGAYLARTDASGNNPAADYIRVAMVQDQETTAEALHRLVAVLG